MNCRYVGNGNRWEYKLLVYPKGGGASQEVGDWKAGPGETFSLTAETSIKKSDIDRVEIRRADGTLVLTHTG
jgi:hypothetical protein